MDPRLARSSSDSEASSVRNQRKRYPNGLRESGCREQHESQSRGLFTQGIRRHSAPGYLIIRIYGRESAALLVHSPANSRSQLRPCRPVLSQRVHQTVDGMFLRLDGRFESKLDQRLGSFWTDRGELDFWMFLQQRRQVEARMEILD